MKALKWKPAVTAVKPAVAYRSGVAGFACWHHAGFAG